MTYIHCYVALIIMKPLDTVEITKCTKHEYVGFIGKLYTNLKCFHANACIFPMPEILAIDENESCIGIVGKEVHFGGQNIAILMLKLPLFNAT